MKTLQNLKHRLFLFHKKVVKEKKIIFLPLFLVLGFISLFWKIIAEAKWYLGELKFIKPYRSDAIVISVGNIVAGGTGKTPLVIKLIKELIKFEKQIGVLSRGYGANLRTVPKKIDSNTPWNLIGDEPKCILNNFKNIALFIGKNRKKSALDAVRSCKRLLILDDGMQQKKLFCNYKLAVVNANEVFGGGYFLPLGYLKDHPKRLTQVDLIIINHCNTKKEYEIAKNKIQKYSSVKTIGVKPVFKSALDFNNKQIELKNQKVGAFSSIANPDTFVNLLKDLDCHIVFSKFFNDHAPISNFELSALDKQSIQNGAKYLICTEKDFVKLNSLKTKLTIIVVKIELEICFEKSNWDNFIEKIHFSMNNLPVIF